MPSSDVVDANEEDGNIEDDGNIDEDGNIDDDV